jgi:hypothetical protein
MMNKKISGILVVTLLIVTAILPVAGTMNVELKSENKIVGDNDKTQDGPVLFAYIDIIGWKSGDTIKYFLFCIAVVLGPHEVHWRVGATLTGTDGTSFFDNHHSDDRETWFLFIDTNKRSWDDLDHAILTTELWIDGDVYYEDRCDVP